ncbi:MAG TPA: hypothetical protein VGZ00_04610 [Candidatus Baltobacteraceae bacterium]|nr:hypothetical protein [Candidatus Baltobacteraceae bacterium]
MGAPDPGKYFDNYPSWRVGRMRMLDPYGWHEIERKAYHHILEHLKALESMTWSEILVKNRKSNHTIQVDDLSREAQKCLENDWQGAGEVISLRLTGKERILGVMDRGVLTILWWDPNHTACPSTKKHT